LIIGGLDAGNQGVDYRHHFSSRKVMTIDDFDLCDPRLHTLLLAIDRDLAAQVRRGGCGHCGGVLHSAQYPRKARGLHLIGPGQDSLSRFSFCCETCSAPIYSGVRALPGATRFSCSTRTPSFGN
jgi:hypothetical protein